ncbi:MAG TPA: phosphopantetheine-binding protein [Baekduia sp.]|nr:phosphopantetheine-binding protein [Baekduia sp.]
MNGTTTSATIANTVFDALETFGVDPALITREATFAELDVDSLDLAELTQIVDDTFDVVLTGDDLKVIKNVGDVLDLIEQRA